MKKEMCAVALLLVFALPASGGEEEKPRISIPQFKALNAEEIAHVIGEGEMTIVHPVKDPSEPLFVTAAGVVNTSPDIVWDVITDWDRYEEFMPQTKDVKVVERTENTAVVDYNLKFKFTIISMRVYYRLFHLLDRSKYYDEWYLVKGDLKEVTGAWRLYPVEGGKKTVAMYTVYSDLRSMGFLVKSILKAEPHIELAIQLSSAALVVKSIKERAEAIAKGEVQVEKTGSEKKEKGSSEDYGF